jgi:hypothetical protein
MTTMMLIKPIKPVFEELVHEDFLVAAAADLAVVAGAGELFVVPPSRRVIA